MPSRISLFVGLAYQFTKKTTHTSGHLVRKESTLKADQVEKKQGVHWLDEDGGDVPFRLNADQVRREEEDIIEGSMNTTIT